MAADDLSRLLQSAGEQLAAGKPAAAVEICRRAIARFPQDARLYFVLALGLAGTKHNSEAIEAYRQAVNVNPHFFEAFNNLGALLIKLGRFDEAVDALNHAVRLRPNLAQLHANLSNALRESWKLEEAVAAAKKALELNPELAEVHGGLGAALLSLGRFDQAADACRAAIQRNNDLPGAHLTLGLAELVLGNLERGWPEYEWRMRHLDMLPPRQTSFPSWDGTRLDGKTILLFSEQGFGDAIQFVRYVPMVVALGGQVILECPAAVLPLFRGLQGVHQLVAWGIPLPACDVQCPLASLPGIFKTTVQSIPAPVPYLAADENIAAAWRKRIEPAKDILQVGLAWSGRPENRNDRNRSIQLQNLSLLGGKPRVRFHSLQTNRTVNPPFEISDWSELLKDFAETAGLIANLDLIISVDTAVAHLAGAIGKPVWVLLPFPPDWRWMLNRADSPWYPTMRLFRQKDRGDWTPAIQAVADALSAIKTPADLRR